MEDYFKPDKRWEMYGLKSPEEYAEKVVIKGYFHDQVPDDVVQAFRTAEYLMAHAYYHWEMFDEAFNKCLFILEMAIKIRAEQNGVVTKRKKDNGEWWYRSINKVIEDLCEPTHLGDLKQRLDRIRNLRNSIAHPVQHSFSGPNGKNQNIQYCVNVINRLFKDEKWHQNRYEKLLDIGERISQLNKDLLVLNRGSKGRVIHACPKYDLIENTLFVACIPLIDVKKIKGDETFLPSSTVYEFQDYTFSKDSISGKSKNGKPIELAKTKNPEVVNANKAFLQYIAEIESNHPYTYLDHVSYDTGWNMVNAEYQYYSNTYRLCHSMS